MKINVDLHLTPKNALSIVVGGCVNADAIQVALTDLARAVLAETLDLKRAAVLAYILQTASANLKHVQIGVFSGSMVTELPGDAAAIAEIDAAYTTFTPRANGDNTPHRPSEARPSDRHSPEPAPPLDVMLTSHGLA
jgi:hypothetical protein